MSNRITTKIIALPLLLSAAGAFGADLSASIGSGHAADVASVSVVAVGSPGVPHWSASIGTGQVSGDSSRRLYADAGRPQAVIPAAHWTAKIGSAHAADSVAKSGKVTS